jgi:hypothetical protein
LPDSVRRIAILAASISRQECSGGICMGELYPTDQHE